MRQKKGRGWEIQTRLHRACYASSDGAACGRTRRSTGRRWGHLSWLQGSWCCPTFHPPKQTGETCSRWKDPRINAKGATELLLESNYQFTTGTGGLKWVSTRHHLSSDRFMYGHGPRGNLPWVTRGAADAQGATAGAGFVRG